MRARKRGALWFLNATFHSISQTSFVFVLIFIALLFGIDILSGKLNPPLEFAEPDIVLLPENVSYVQDLRYSLISHNDDSYSSYTPKSLEAIFADQWIKDFSLKIDSDIKKIYVTVEEHVPIAKVEFLSPSKIKPPIQFINYTNALFSAPASYENKYQHIPHIKAEENPPIEGRSLSQNIEEFLKFLNAFNQSDIQHLFDIRSVMIVNFTYYIEFKNNARINIINEKPEQLIGPVKEVLRKLPMHHFLNDQVIFRNENDIYIKVNKFENQNKPFNFDEFYQ